MKAEIYISHQEARIRRINDAESVRTERVHWQYGNSSLLKSRDPRDPRDPFSFNSSFAPLILERRWFGKKINLKQYVERVFSHKKGQVVGMEIGGPGSNLFAGFTSRFFKKSAGVNLPGPRDESKEQQDEKIHHTRIPGNILLEETHQRVEEWLHGDKIDFLVLRMLGGLDSLPNEPFYMSKQANYWYKHLAEGGVFFSEVPLAFMGYKGAGDFMSAWVKKVNREYKGKLHVKYNRRKGIIRLRKLQNAPEDLPLLDARVVVEARRKAQQWDRRRSTTQF